MPYLYHLCSHDFRGTTLYPLHAVRERWPDVYDREKQKWQGRESVLEYIVPGLGVAWADTVNLSALDPRYLLEERRSLGIPVSRLLERRLVCIPVERVSPTPAVLYRNLSYWLNNSPGDLTVPRTPPESEFTPFDASCHEEPCGVPALHREYLLRQKQRAESALSFVFVPHVLVAGPVDLSGLNFIALEG